MTWPNLGVISQNVPEWAEKIHEKPQIVNLRAET